MIICVVGKNKSGKSKVAEWIQEYTKFPLVEVSTLVKKFANSNVRKDLQLEKNKHQDDPDWLFREIRKEIHTDNCIVSGIRELSILEKLQQAFKEVVVIAAIVDDEVREERGSIIAEKVEEFIEDEKRDQELFDLDVLIAKAEATIDTSAEAEDTKAGIVILLRDFFKIG